MIMVKVKTAELTGAALDWAVAKAVDWRLISDVPHNYEGGDSTDTYAPAFSTDWRHGGPLIDEHDVWLSDDEGACVASCEPHIGRYVVEGGTNLIAICRAVVATKLGEEVEVPQELLS